jgi:hypothetical protein
MRVSKDFKEWCDKMKKEKSEITENKEEQLSDRKITWLLPKHRESLTIRNDLLNFVWKDNNKGMVHNLFIGITVALVSIIMIGVLGFVFTSIYAGLNQDVMIGQVNLSNATQETFGVFENAYNNNMDILGLILIFGMIGGVLIASFMLRGTQDKLLILIDIIILIVVYIFAVLISNYYETLLIASQNVFTQFEYGMPKTSNFILHLPRWVTLIGVGIMVLLYSSIPKRDTEKDISYEGVSPSEY